jgi:hypothetical protein
MKHCSAVRRGEVVHRAPVLVRGVDVEKTQLVRARGVIGLRLFHRVARIAQVDEIHALDHAAVGDVETGDDAGLQHGAVLSDLRQRGKAGVGYAYFRER